MDKKELTVIDEEKENKIENSKKEKRFNIKTIFKKLINKYKEWNGIGSFLIICFVLIAIFMLVHSSFKLNHTYASRDKVAIENANVQTRADINAMLTDGFTMEGIKQIASRWIKVNYADKFFYNYVLVLGSFLFIYMIVGKTKLSLVISTFIWIFIDIANYVVLKIRGTALAISDVFSIGTALTVTDGLKFEPGKNFYKFITFIVLYIFFLVIIKFKKKDKTRKIINIIKRVLAIIVSILCLNFVLNIEGFRADSYWDLEEKYRLFGIEYSVLRQALDLKIDKPENYSKQKVEEILSRYNIKSENDEKANIIVVMNESFADLNKIYGLGIEDNMPYYNSLKENTVKGTLYTSVFGGGTATAEWEMFTGNSASFIPVNSIPLILYVNDEKETVMQGVKKQGYQTVAIHPYYKDGYNRATSYPKLGFDKSLFIEDMNDYERTFTFYPSDKYAYEKLIKEYEARDKSKKFFGYLLTMQNHLPYTTPNEFYMPDGYVSGNDELDEYLSLIKDSDDALKELITYYSNEKEKTVILFFGDHQPAIEFEHDRNNTEDKWMATQEVPYMLWANFDIEEIEGDDLSFNYLSMLLYDYAGIESTRYIEFLKEFKSIIPVFTSKGYKDKYGNTYKLGEESPYNDLINEYRILQYYYMFDHKVK